MGEAHRAFTSMDRVLQRTTTNSDNKVSKLIDQLKARTDEFTAATNKTMNAINPTGDTRRAHARLRHRCKCRRLHRGRGDGRRAGRAGVISAMRAPQLKEARDEAKRLFQKFTVMAPPPDGNDLEERVGDMERKLGETRVTLQERVTAVRAEAMETTGHGAGRPSRPGCWSSRCASQIWWLLRAHRQRRAEHCKVGGDRVQVASGKAHHAECHNGAVYAGGGIVATRATRVT